MNEVRPINNGSILEDNVEKVFIKEYDINYDDVDYNLTATMPAIANLFGDITFRHGNAVGGGTDTCRKEHKAWVFYKYEISVLSHPKVEDRVVVSTEAVGFKKFYGYRKYLLENTRGDLLVEGKAMFFLIDTEKRKAIRIPQREYEMFGVSEELREVFDIENVKKIDNCDYEKIFRVRYSDIDSNLHVNNVKYMEWAIEGVPEHILQGYRLMNLVINYLKETMLGHMITSKSTIIEKGDSIEIIHKIVDEENMDLATAKTIWTRV